MPKVAVGTPEVTIASIQQQIAEIEFLLEGRLDSDNIQREGTVVSQIGSGRINGIAEFSKPVTADKLFGTYDTKSFYNDILLRLYSLVETRPQFDVLQAKFAFDIRKGETYITAENSPYLIMGSEVSKSIADENTRILSDLSRLGAQYNALIRDDESSALDSSQKYPLPSLPGPGSFYATGGIVAVGSPYRQTKYIKHPRNYKVALKGDISNSDSENYGIKQQFVDGNGNLVELTADDVLRINAEPVVSVSFSVKLLNDADEYVYIKRSIIISPLDPEVTAVTMFVDPEGFLVSDPDYFFVLLADVDILFKVIP